MKVLKADLHEAILSAAPERESRKAAVKGFECGKNSFFRIQVVTRVF